MFTCIIFILCLLSLLFIILRRKKSAIVFLCLGLASFWYAGSGLLPSLLLTHLQNTYEVNATPAWKNQNAIILLGAGTTKLGDVDQIEPTIMAYSRIVTSTRLYFACKQAKKHCTIIISGGDAAKTGHSEADVYQKALFNLGVPRADLILEDKSMNTYQNAEFASRILKSKSFDGIYLVTTGLHLTRALLYFRQFGINPIPMTADYITAPFSLVAVGYNLAMTDFTVHEYAGILRLYIYNYFGWNAPAKNTAGSI